MHKFSLLFTLFILFSAAAAATAQHAWLVGGRTQIQDVKTNAEVQDLGRFSVEQFNRGLHHDAATVVPPLAFREVVEGQRQVVAGLKYYLKVAAAAQDGVTRKFDAVVVVKPWMQSKDLLNFGPSS